MSEKEQNGKKKGNVHALFGTDKKAEQEGIIIEYGDGEDAFSFRVARAGGSNKAYLKKLEALCRPHLRQIKNDTLSRKKQQEIMIKAYVGTVILGWTNVRDKTGTVLEFSHENCTKLFKEYPDLFADLASEAGRANLFREEMLELARGNS